MSTKLDEDLWTDDQVRAVVGPLEAERDEARFDTARAESELSDCQDRWSRDAARLRAERDGAREQAATQLDEWMRLSARADRLAEAGLVLLDQVDYTAGACSIGEMVGAVLPKVVIEKARAALAEYEAGR